MSGALCSTLAHPHIVQAQRLQRTPHFLLIVTEYANGGTLNRLIHDNRGGLPEDAARYLFQQVLLTVRFCHRLNIRIRNIDLENFLVFWKDGKPIVKIANLGFAKDVETEVRHANAACMGCLSTAPRRSCRLQRLDCVLVEILNHCITRRDTVVKYLDSNRLMPALVWCAPCAGLWFGSHHSRHTMAHPQRHCWPPPTATRTPLPPPGPRSLEQASKGIET